MKITKIQNHGQVRYRVNDANGPDGKRQRKFFETREEAEQYLKDRRQDTRTFGVHFVTIPPAERAVISHELDRLKQLGWTLSAAVDFIERHGKAMPALTLAKVIEEFLAAKETAGLRPRYVKTLSASIKRFQIGRREKLITAICPNSTNGQSGRSANLRPHQPETNTNL